MDLSAIYAAKGKAKESRRISCTTSDIGTLRNAELQSDERSLDPGEYVSVSSFTLLPTFKHTLYCVAQLWRLGRQV